jgi:hypothetical protein
MGVNRFDAYLVNLKSKGFRIRWAHFQLTLHVFHSIAIPRFLYFQADVPFWGIYAPTILC